MYILSILSNTGWGFNDTQTLEDHDLKEFYYRLTKSAPLNLMLHRTTEDAYNYTEYFNALAKEYYSGNMEKTVQIFSTFLECHNLSIEVNIHKILQLPLKVREEAMEEYIHQLELHRDVFHGMLIKNRL